MTKIIYYLSEAMNVSPSLLYKKIKSFTYKLPSEFIRTIRLKYALELIQSRKFSVAEVSELSGFTNASYFSACFKNYFGKVPTEV